MSSAPTEPTFHTTSSAYTLPNDSPEHVRLERQSASINAMMGHKPLRAPLVDATKILEVGCGTGHMTCLMAERFPSAHVYGLDLSTVPAIRPKPDNVTYIQGDIMEVEDERLQAGTFDFIFSRMLVLGITNWPAYAKKCFSLLKPGGYLEIQDYNWRRYNINYEEISQGWLWLQALEKAVKIDGVDLYCTDHIQHDMKDAGFTDVDRYNFKWNFGLEHWEQHPDSDEIGRYTQEAALNNSIILVLTRSAPKQGWTEQELQDYVQNCNDTFGGSSNKLPKGEHCNFWVFVGRKP